MTPRIRLGLVTALTIASMLLGGGAMSALAQGNGNGNGHARGHAKQEARAAVADVVAAPDSVTGEGRPGGERPGLGCGDENHVHTGPPGNPDQECPTESEDGD